MTPRPGVIKKVLSGAEADGVRTQLPSPDALSSQDWVGEAAAKALPVVARSLTKGCEAFQPRLIFLAGSGIHGELSGIIDVQGRRTFLSDLDIGIVTADSVPPEVRSQTLRELEPICQDGPKAIVGFYLLRVLGRHFPTLGLVEAARCGYVLEGDATLLSRFRMPTPRRIPTWEARRLLANRVLEWMEAGEAQTPASHRVYAAGKLIVDMAAVGLLGRRLYAGGGIVERFAALARLGGADPEIRRIDLWTRWRITPTWATTPLGCDVDAAAASSQLDEEVRAAVRWVIRFLTGASSVRGLFGNPKLGGRVWVRAWKRWRRERRTSILAFGIGGLRRTPRVVLWEAAVEQLVGEPRRAADLLDRLEGGSMEPSASNSERIRRIAKRMNREGID